MGRQFLLKAREASAALLISDKDLVPQPLTIFGTLQWSWGLNLIGMLTTPKGSERSPRKSRQTLYNLLTLNSNPRKKNDMVKLALEFGHSRDSKHFQTFPNSISLSVDTLRTALGKFLVENLRHLPDSSRFCWAHWSWVHSYVVGLITVFLHFPSSIFFCNNNLLNTDHMQHDNLLRVAIVTEE